MGTLNEDLASIKEVEDTITANKVANFAYTDKAYTDNDANGVIEYDVSKEQNIPSSDASILKVNETVLQKGYRAQASSVTRMLLNHFFGRVSYNLNKVNDCVSNLVATLGSHLGKANGIATLDNDGHIPYSQLPESAVEYKGNWNANTNTPQLVDGTGNLGDLYIVSVAGIRDLGSGEVNYLVGDRIIYNQNNIWEKLSGGSVRSVENHLPDASGNISLPVAGMRTKGLVVQSDLIVKVSKNLNLGSNRLQSVAFGNNLFVAVGTGDYILTSSDGINWNEVYSNVKFNSVTFGNNLFVAVGSYGNIKTSTDGITWTSRTSHVDPGAYLYEVIYANNMFVAVGDKENILTSPDGITWTKVFSGINHTLSSVAFGNNLFVAGGGGGKPITSTDGITWTKKDSNFSGVVNKIVFGNNLFVAVGQGGRNATSPNGITWTKQKNLPIEVGKAAIFANNMFFAVSSSTGQSILSADGINWIDQGTSFNAAINGVIYVNNMFVAVGNENVVHFLVEIPNNSVKVDENGVMTVPGIAELETKADSLDTKVDSLDTKVDSLEVKIDDLNVKANTPRWLRFDFSASNKQTLKILANTHIRVENTTVHFDTDTSFDLSTTINATSGYSGSDWYVFLDTEGNVTCSLSKTEPAGKRRIGQFHTLCADAGTNVTGIVPTELTTTGGNFLIKRYNEEEDNDFYTFYNKPITAITTGDVYNVGTVAHPLSGFVENDILHESVWCLTFHPSCASYDGMVYDRDCDIAVDIYLQSGKGKATKSAFGAPLTEARRQWNHQEDMRAVGKRFLKDYEFTSIASGSNEKTNIKGNSTPNTTGGHVDTNGRRMISFIGCEECCGYKGQWLDEFCGEKVDSASDWRDNDGQGSFGQQLGVTKCLIAGGGWSYSSRCGSRFRTAWERSDMLQSAARGSAGIIRSVQ